MFTVYKRMTLSIVSMNVYIHTMIFSDKSHNTIQIDYVICINFSTRIFYLFSILLINSCL